MEVSRGAEIHASARKRRPKPPSHGAPAPLPDPTEVLQQRLEFFFSDSNLHKDSFLRGLTGDNGTAFVPLSTLALFPRIAGVPGGSLTSLVKGALCSPLLRLSDDETAVARNAPYIHGPPDAFDDRTVYVEGFPEGYDHDSLTSYFSQWGPVAYVSLPRFRQNRKLKGFAFVEFSTPSAAHAAVHAHAASPTSSSAQNDAGIASSSPRRRAPAPVSISGAAAHLTTGPDSRQREATVQLQPDTPADSKPQRTGGTGTNWRGVSASRRHNDEDEEEDEQERASGRVSYGGPSRGAWRGLWDVTTFASGTPAGEAGGYEGNDGVSVDGRGSHSNAAYDDDMRHGDNGDGDSDGSGKEPRDRDDGRYYDPAAAGLGDGSRGGPEDDATFEGADGGRRNRRRRGDTYSPTSTVGYNHRSNTAPGDAPRYPAQDEFGRALGGHHVARTREVLDDGNTDEYHPELEVDPQRRRARAYSPSQGPLSFGTSVRQHAHGDTLPIAGVPGGASRAYSPSRMVGPDEEPLSQGHAHHDAVVSGRGRQRDVPAYSPSRSYRRGYQADAYGADSRESGRQAYSPSRMPPRDDEEAGLSTQRHLNHHHFRETEFDGSAAETGRGRGRRFSRSGSAEGVGAGRVGIRSSSADMDGGGSTGGVSEGVGGEENEYVAGEGARSSSPSHAALPFADEQLLVDALDLSGVDAPVESADALTGASPPGNAEYESMFAFEGDEEDEGRGRQHVRGRRGLHQAERLALALSAAYETSHARSFTPSLLGGLPAGAPTVTTRFESEAAGGTCRKRPRESPGGSYGRGDSVSQALPPAGAAAPTTTAASLPPFPRSSPVHRRKRRRSESPLDERFIDSESESSSGTGDSDQEESKAASRGSDPQGRTPWQRQQHRIGSRGQDVVMRARPSSLSPSSGADAWIGEAWSSGDRSALPAAPALPHHRPTVPAGSTVTNAGVARGGQGQSFGLWVVMKADWLAAKAAAKEAARALKLAEAAAAGLRPPPLGASSGAGPAPSRAELPPPPLPPAAAAAAAAAATEVAPGRTGAHSSAPTPTPAAPPPFQRGLLVRLTNVPLSVSFRHLRDVAQVPGRPRYIDCPAVYSNGVVDARPLSCDAKAGRVPDAAFPSNPLPPPPPPPPYGGGGGAPLTGVGAQQLDARAPVAGGGGGGGGGGPALGGVATCTEAVVRYCTPGEAARSVVHFTAPPGVRLGSSTLGARPVTGAEEEEYWRQVAGRQEEYQRVKAAASQPLQAARR